MPGKPRLLGSWIKRSLLSGPRPQTGPPSPPPIEQSQTEYIERFGPGGEAYGRNPLQQSLDNGNDSGDGEADERKLDTKKSDATADGVFPCKLSNLPYASDDTEVKAYAEAALATALEEARALDDHLDPRAWTLVCTMVGDAPDIKFPDLSALRDRLRELSSSDLPRGTGLLLFASRAAAAAVASRLDNQILGGRALKASTGLSNGGGSGANKEGWDGRYWSHGLSSKKRPRGGVQCYRCGQWGHMRDECTDQQVADSNSSSSSSSGSTSGPVCQICARQHSEEDRRAMIATGRPWDHLCPGAMNVHARVEQAAAITADATAMEQFAGVDEDSDVKDVLEEEAGDGRREGVGVGGREYVRCMVCAGAGHLSCNRPESINNDGGSSDTELDMSTSSVSDSSEYAMSPDKAEEEEEEEDAEYFEVDEETTPAVSIFCFHCGASGHSGEVCLAEKAAVAQQMVQEAFQHPQGHQHPSHSYHNYNSSSSGNSYHHDYNQSQHNSQHQNQYNHQQQQHYQEQHQYSQSLPPYASDQPWQLQQQQQQEWQQQSHQQRLYSRYHSQAPPRLDQEPWQPADSPRDRQRQRSPESQHLHHDQQQQQRKRSQRDRESASCSRGSSSTTSRNDVVAGKATGRLLVLFDLNGTLIHRAPGYNGRSQNADAALPSPSSTAVVAPDHVHNSVAYYIRPEAKSLIQALRSCPNVVPGFYTSMTASNARPAVALLGGNGFGLYDRPYNQPDPDATEHWTSMRDLPRVWSAERGPAYGFDETCTLTVDDTLSKMRYWPRNRVLIPTFTDPTTPEATRDCAIANLRAWLLPLVDRWKSGDDIRAFVDKAPSFLPPPSLASTSSTSDVLPQAAAVAVALKVAQMLALPVPPSTATTSSRPQSATLESHEQQQQHGQQAQQSVPSPPLDQTPTVPLAVSGDIALATAAKVAQLLSGGPIGSLAPPRYAADYDYSEGIPFGGAAAASSSSSNFSYSNSSPSSKHQSASSAQPPPTRSSGLPSSSVPPRRQAPPSHGSLSSSLSSMTTAAAAASSADHHQHRHLPPQQQLSPPLRAIPPHLSPPPPHRTVQPIPPHLSNPPHLARPHLRAPPPQPHLNQHGYPNPQQVNSNRFQQQQQQRQHQQQRQQMQQQHQPYSYGQPPQQHQYHPPPQYQQPPQQHQQQWHQYQQYPNQQQHQAPQYQQPSQQQPQQQQQFRPHYYAQHAQDQAAPSAHQSQMPLPYQNQPRR